MHIWARDNFLASRQRNTVEPWGPEQMRKIFKSRCLDGVSTLNIVILPYQTLWPDIIVKLSRQYCRVPSCGKMV